MNWLSSGPNRCRRGGEQAGSRARYGVRRSKCGHCEGMLQRLNLCTGKRPTQPAGTKHAAHDGAAAAATVAHTRRQRCTAWLPLKARPPVPTQPITRQHPTTHLQAALHHVVAVEVADEGHHPWLQRINHQLDLQAAAWGGQAAWVSSSRGGQQAGRAGGSLATGAEQAAKALPQARSRQPKGSM